MIYAKIIFIRRNGTDGTFYPLTSRTCLFGRHEECDIPIKLREVADNHCQINVKEDGEILLTNLTGNSTSVSLNGSPVINTVPLRHRDVFCIRKRSFRFEVPNPMQKNPSNKNAVSGAELIGAISQINSSDGSHQNEDTPQPLVMENTDHKNIETQGNSVSVTDGNDVETRSSTTNLERLNSSGLQMCHLRRIGPPATKPGVADVMDFWKVTSLIGRKATQIDFLIDSSDYVQGAYVSRLHARMVRRQNNIHCLFDDSLNGVFVNNFKIAGHVDLQVGDRVTFGHPQGSRLSAGTRVHQPDSEYQFMFEICSCLPDSKPPHHQEHNSTPHLEEHNAKRVPSSFRVPSELCVPKSKTAKQHRNATRTFTQEDIATCQSQNVGTSFKVEMNEGSDQEQNSIFKSADKMQTVPVRNDDSLETGHVGRDVVQQTGLCGSRTEVDAVHRSVERIAVGDVEHNRISFEAILGHLQEEAVLETGPSGSGLGSNEGQQVVNTGSVTCMATMKNNSVTVIHQDTVPNRAVLDGRKPGIGNQEEFIAEDLLSPGPEASICGRELADNAGFRTVVNDSDVDMEAVYGEELVQNESPKDHQNNGKDDMEEDQANNLFDFNDISKEQHQDTLISVEQVEPQQSVNVLDNNVNAEQIFKCSDKSVTEIEKKESSTTMVALSLPEPDLDDEFNEIVMKVKTELLAVSSQGDRTDDAELGGDDTNSAQDEIYIVDSQVENIHPNIDSNGSMGIISAGESGAINTEAVDRTEITELDHKIGLSTMMDMEVSGPVSHGTEDSHPSFVNSFDNKNYGKEEVFETGSAIIVEKISVKDSRQPYVDGNGCQPMKSAEQEQLIQETEELNNETVQQNIESVDIKEKVHGLINIVLKSVENVELKNTPFHQMVETSDMAMHLASEDEGTNGVPVSHKHDIVDNSHLVKDITSIQQQSVSVDAVEMYQNVAFHEKESSMEISDPGKQLNHVVETEKGSDNIGKEDFIFGEKELAQEVSYTEDIMNQEVASFKMQDDIDKVISCFEEDFAKEASNTGQQDDDNTMSDRSLQNILVNEKATDQRDTSYKLNVLSGIEDNSTSVLLDSRLSGIEDNSTSVLLDSRLSGIEDNSTSVLLDSRLSGIEDNSTSVLLDSGLSGIEDSSTSVLLDSRMEREQAVSLSQKESFEDISGEDNFSDITSFKDPFSEIMANPEENMEPGHVFIGNNKVEFVSDNDGKSSTVVPVQGKDRGQEIFSFENKSFQDISIPEEESLKLVASFEKESSELITNPEEKIETGQMSIENNELEVLSDLDGKSTIALSVQEKDRDQEISSFEKKSFQDVSDPEEKSYIPLASFEKQSSEVISDPEEKMEQGIVPVENSKLQVVSDTRQNSATVLSDPGNEGGHAVTSIEKKSFQDVSKPEEDNFSEVASFEEKSLESVSDPEEKIEHGHMSVENNELEVLSDHEKSSTVLSDQGKERDQGIPMFQKESFEKVDNPEEDNFRNVASFEDSSTEVISNSEENMDPGHVTLENNEPEVLSDLDEKSTTVLSDQRKEWNHTVSLCEKESFEDIPKVEAVRFKDIASFEKESLEVTSNSEEKMEPGHVFIANNEFLSDLDEKSTTLLSVQGKERDQGIPFFEKETFEGISYPEEDSLKLVISFENESSELITNPEEKIEPGHVSMENNELEVISDLDKKSTTVVCVQGKEREHDFSSFEKKSFQDISNPEELNFIPVASFEKETSEVTSDPEEKKEQGLLSVENNELEVLSDLDEKSSTVLSVQGKERDQGIPSFEKESFEDISNCEEKSLKLVTSCENESSEVIMNPEENIEPGHVSMENNELEILSDLDEKSITVLSVQGKEKNQTVSLCEKEFFEDISNPEGDRLKHVASFEKESSEVITSPEEKIKSGQMSIENNNELEVLSDFDKSTTILSEQGKVDQGISLFQKESFENVTNPKEDNFRHVASFEDSSSDIISISEEKMDPGHMPLENNELEVLSNLDEKSTTVLSNPGKEGDHAVTSFEKKSFQDVSNPEEDSFSEVASFEEKSLESVSDPEEKIEHGHMSIENNKLEVLSDLDEKSTIVQSVQGKERDQEIPLFEKESFEDISNPEEDSLKHVASFENESSEVITNPEEKKELRHRSLENNELEVLSDLDEKSTTVTVQSVQGKERNQTVKLCEKEFFEDISDPEGDRLKHVASFEKESSEVITNPEEKMKPGQMSIENSELEVLSDLDKKSASVLSDPGKERDHAVALFVKVSLQDISNPEEKMELERVSVENYDLEFLSDLDEKSAKGEGLGAGLLDDKSPDADKKCSNSLSYEKTDECYAAVCQDKAQERQSFAQVETKHKMEISEDDHSFSDQSNTGDIREGTFQQGCSQDLFENSSQWNVSRIGCTDMIYGIASTELKSVEIVEPVSKSGKKRKLSEIFQENDAADDDNGCVPTGVPLKKMLLPENEHSGKSFSKDEVKDKSLVLMDWYEMRSSLEHKTIDTKVVVENDTVESLGCATSSVQNPDSGRQQVLPENDREIENNDIRKYFPGEDQSTLPIDCGRKTSEFKDNAAHDKAAICIIDTVDDSSSSMNLTFSNEQQYLPENHLETNEEFLSRVSSKEISDTENHERVEVCNVAMNDGDCNVESPADSLKLLSSTGEFQIIGMEGLSRREFKADSVAVMSDENAELSDLSSEDIESSELVSDKDAESSQIDCVKGAWSSALARHKDVESSELAKHKDVESSELARHKDVESSELVSDENVKSELVMDKDAESLELVNDKDAESSELGDTNAESSELVMDKDAESSELVIDEDAELSKLVMDKGAESSELVIDEDAELSKLVMDKDAESSELGDKNAESSESVINKDGKSSELGDTNADSSELGDKNAESSEIVINKDAESSKLGDTNAESSELVMDKDAESSELFINEDAELSELVMVKDAESSELVMDKAAESSELGNKNVESSESVIDKDAESSELGDKNAESLELVMDKDAESSELVIDEELSELVLVKDAESSELVMDKDAESSELVMDKDAESSELVIDEDAELSELVLVKDTESSEHVMDKDAESSELVIDEDAELSELVMDKGAESSELVIDEDAESSELVVDKDAKSSELVVDKDVESSKLVCDKDSELSVNGSGRSSVLSEKGNIGNVENDLYMNDSTIKDNPERQYYFQDEETTSTIEPCDQSEGSSQRSDDLHTEPAMHPDLDTANEKAWEKRGCGEEINRDVDELLSVQTENRDKQGEVMQLTDKSSVLNAKKTWQLSETGMKSETKSKEFAPYVEGHGEEMKPCSSPESEPLISLGSDDWDANSDVAMDTTENDTDSTLNDSTMKCLPFISAPVGNENVISVDQVKETRCFVWSSNHLDDFSQQHAMSPVIPQQTRIFPKASTADQNELLFSDQSDDDDNGISSLKISALVDEIQKTPIVDEAGSLLEKTPNFSSNVVSSSLEFKNEAISKSQRSDDSDHFNLDFSDIVDDIIYDNDDDDDDDERPVYDRYKDVKEDNVSNVNPSDEENVEDEDYVNENEEEHISGNYGENIVHVDMEDNENVEETFHGITSDDNITDNVEEEEPHAIMLTRRNGGCSSGVKRKLKKNDNVYKSPEKVRRSFIGPLDSPSEGQILEGKNQRCNESDSSSSDSHGRGKNVSYPDQSDLVSTESELSLDAARSPSKYTSVRRQLEYKVKGKSRFQTIKEKLIHLSKDSKEESKASSPMASSSSSQETLGEMPPHSSQHNQFPPEGDHEKVTTLVTRCKSILEKFRKILNRQMDVLQTHRMQALIDELGTIEKWSELPQIVIAVVGNTGDGKSSLMNALLGHSSILPTSGIRACTAVVVEVVQNSGSLYEGCIEFLTKEEWYSELERLIKDLTLSDGTLRKKPPDPGSELYVSYCKVKAVYGKIDRFEVLAEINKVTSHLGQKRNVKCKQAKNFRLEVERYIETQEPQSGGQFWPIVKRVQLRLPNCDVCSTGAVLVDLPGVRDSNAARDKIARDYLKTCSAIWVVSAIHRAIDDKTAQDLLTENFRRQLLMDGQYGSVAFICTKSDQFENSEIIRTLKLQEKCKDHEQKISIMEKKKQRLLEEIKICRKRTHNLNAEIKSSLKECEDLQSLVQEIETQQMDANQNQSVDYEPMEEAKVLVKEKEKEREKNKEAIQEIAEDIDNYERQIQELETQIRQRRRKLSHICASARNDYCREKIKQKFQSGLKEIKRQANRLPDADEDDDDDDDDDDDNDEDAEEVNRMVKSLKVFCCSSTEYQKMKELIPADGEPTVFNCLEETEIPSLQAYVHELTRIRHEQYLERLIRGLGRCTFNFQSYLLDGGTECVETRTGVKLVIERYLQDLNSMIQPVLQKMAEDLESTFNDMVQPKFHEGVGLAAQEVTGICQKWGSKQSTDQANRRAGGLHWTTYKATMQRLGVYSSPTFGNIDMNEELSEPFYRTITVVWSRVFSSVLWKILETVQTDILEKIQHFNQKVRSELQKMGFPTNRIDQMKEQVESSVKYKLTEMVLHLKPLVTAKQRDISRILSPHVQSRLVETYSAAASHTGKGSFQRMKQEMENGIDSRKMYVFDDGSQKMMHELLNLKTELVNTVTAVCDMLLEEIKLSFEPLWEDPSQSVLLRDTLQQHMEEVCEEMKTIYRDASLQNTEEHAQSRKKPATTQHPPIPKRPQERMNVIEIVNMFISPVPEELTKMTNLEVIKVEKGSHMYPVKDVKQKPGLSSDSGIHNPSDIASSSGIDVTRIKREGLSEFNEFLHHYKVEPPSPTAMLPSEDSVNPTFTSMAGPSNVYDFGEASVTKNIQHDQTHKKIIVCTKQRHNRIAPKNVPPEVQLALENHMVKRSKEHSFKHGHAIDPIIAKQQTENSSITAAAQEKAESSSIASAAQEEAVNSARGSSTAMVSLLKPKPGTSTAAKEKQPAAISISDSRQLVPAKKKTSSTSTMETSLSGQAGTSLIRPKETTLKGTEGNSCNIKRNPSSDLKRTAPSVNTGTTASGIKTALSDKMGTSLPIIEDDDSLPEISIAKRRKKTYREQNNPLYENVQENPTCTHGTGKISQKISTDTSLSTSSVSSRPRLPSNTTAISKTQNSKETGSSKSPQRNKLRIEHSLDSSSSSEMLQIIKREPQEVDHFPHKQQSRRKQNLIIIDLTLSDDE